MKIHWNIREAVLPNGPNSPWNSEPGKNAVTASGRYHVQEALK